MLRAALLVLALVLASAGCNRVQIVSHDPARAAWVKSAVILPFTGVDVTKYQVKAPPGDADALEWNTKAATEYGGFPKRFSEAVVAASKGGITYADKEPASGFFVKGYWEKVTPGSSGLRIGGIFTPTAGGAMAEEGKVEIRFTCWLKEVGKDKETPIATFSGEHEDKNSWSGGYDVVWDLAEVLAKGLAQRLPEVCPDLPK